MKHAAYVSFVFLFSSIVFWTPTAALGDESGDSLQIILEKQDDCAVSHLIVKNGQASAEILSAVQQLVAHSFNPERTYTVGTSLVRKDSLEAHLERMPMMGPKEEIPFISNEEAGRILADQSFQRWAGVSVIKELKKLLQFQNDMQSAPSPEKQEPIDDARQAFLKALETHHKIQMVTTDLDCY